MMISYMQPFAAKSLIDRAAQAYSNQNLLNIKTRTYCVLATFTGAAFTLACMAATLFTLPGVIVTLNLFDAPRLTTRYFYDLTTANGLATFIGITGAFNTGIAVKIPVVIQKRSNKAVEQRIAELMKSGKETIMSRRAKRVKAVASLQGQPNHAKAQLRTDVFDSNINYYINRHTAKFSQDYKKMNSLKPNEQYAAFRSLEEGLMALNSKSAYKAKILPITEGQYQDFLVVKSQKLVTKLFAKFDLEKRLVRYSCVTNYKDKFDPKAFDIAVKNSQVAFQTKLIQRMDKIRASTQKEREYYSLDREFGSLIKEIKKSVNKLSDPGMGRRCWRNFRKKFASNQKSTFGELCQRFDHWYDPSLKAGKFRK